MLDPSITKEERDMLRSKVGERLEGVFKARSLILDTGLNSGSVECPMCGGKLHFTVARSNGHVHGHCETRLCLIWME
jgi:hypothetical protein